LREVFNPLAEFRELSVIGQGDYPDIAGLQIDQRGTIFLHADLKIRNAQAPIPALGLADMGGNFLCQTHENPEMEQPQRIRGEIDPI
jgi:hypothetical protein